MLDSTVIEVRAGNGGHGIVSFIREALLPRGGPGGGDGGHGGDVVLIADSSINTLTKFHWQPHFIAKNGSNGQGHHKNGAKGETVEVTVPVGTEVWIWEDSKDKELIGELIREGDQMIVAEGGRGGWGNAHFVSATHQEPLLAEAGGYGEIRRIRLNLKLLADVGLIGMPNAGKSSILTAISAARPKIGDYPFTTIEPVLGVVDYKHKTFVAVDIPGLIKGAHQGIGLGDEFLKHIQRTQVLVHVVDGSEDNIAERIMSINEEISRFDTELIKKPQILAINKFDLDDIKNIKATNLSGGEKRKTAIAAALLGDPNIILLDEPFAALDILTIQMLQKIIVDLQVEHHSMCVLLADHQPRELLAVCDKALILSNSHIVAEGSPNELLNNVHARKHYFGDKFKA